MNHGLTVRVVCSAGDGAGFDERRRRRRVVPQIDKVKLELSVVLGATTMPIHQLLRMGRGAVIELSAAEGDAVTLLANDHPIALGSVFVNGDRIGVEITSMLLNDDTGRGDYIAADRPAAAA
jgi:flagellar motor switch protein FliN/FliY